MAKISTRKPRSSQTSSIWPDMAPSSDPKISKHAGKKNLPLTFGLIAFFLPILAGMTTSTPAMWLFNPFGIFTMFPLFAEALFTDLWLLVLLFLAGVIIAYIKFKHRRPLVVTLALLIVSITYSLFILGLARLTF